MRKTYAGDIHGHRLRREIIATILANEVINRGTGVIPFEARKLAFGMGLDAAVANKFAKLLDSIYKAFIETDASMIEINPLILTRSGDRMPDYAKFR